MLQTLAQKLMLLVAFFRMKTINIRIVSLGMQKRPSTGYAQHSASFSYKRAMLVACSAYRTRSKLASHIALDHLDQFL